LSGWYVRGFASGLCHRRCPPKVYQLSRPASPSSSRTSHRTLSSPSNPYRTTRGPTSVVTIKSTVPLLSRLQWGQPRNVTCSAIVSSIAIRRFMCTITHRPGMPAAMNRISGQSISSLPYQHHEIPMISVYASQSSMQEARPSGVALGHSVAGNEPCHRFCKMCRPDPGTISR
jgi:hypothetical protein